MTVAADEEVAYEGAKEGPEPFAEEVPGSGDHKKSTYTEVGHEEIIPETFPEVKEDDNVQLEIEGVDEKPLP